MSLFKIARVAVAAAAAMFASHVFADTATLTVSASVSGTCKIFSSTTPSMSFTLDPSQGGDKTSTHTFQYKCTKKASAPTFTVAGESDGSYTGSMSGPDTAIPYTITWNNTLANPSGFSGDPVDIVLTGTVTEANYLDRLAGAYNNGAGIALVISY